MHALLPQRRSMAAKPRCSHAELLHLEVSPLLQRRCTGIARFTARLIEALAARVPLRLFTTLDRDATRQLGVRPDLLAGQALTVPAGALGRADQDVEGWIRTLLRRPKHRWEAGQARDGVALFTQLRPATRQFRREVGIFYDFTPVLLPWAHVEGTRGLFGTLFAETCRQFDRVIAISRSTQADARWLSPLDAAQVVHCYPGPSLCITEHADPGPAVRSANLILVVATQEPRKNGAFLLDWFYRTRALGPEAELCWVGPAGWAKTPAAAQKATRKVHFLRGVDDRVLCRLYRQAAFTIYPSLYEGFGFPVLDALRHGVPVVCSFNSSLQEFAGPGVYFFDPCDAASLDSACLNLLRGPPCPVDLKPLDARYCWDSLACTILELSRG